MEYKSFQLQELFEIWKTGFINLFFGVESHVRTSGYCPYGWQFPHEEVFVPCANKHRLNILGMISPVCQYAGLECEKSITGEKLAHFLEEFSKGITKPTVIVLDNGSIHHRGFVAKEKKKWEEKGLYIFYLPLFLHTSILRKLYGGCLKANGSSLFIIVIKLCFMNRPEKFYRKLASCIKSIFLVRLKYVFNLNGYLLG